jgi:PTH1 family peptidyl-tRNA hydrolase
MPLLVGLGNPGPKYDATRHNIGFALADSVARAAGADGWKTWGKALVCKAAPGSISYLLAKPQTFMNLSGEAVQALMAFYKIPPSDLVVITDDVTLPLGSLRIRASGGHGGHNGLRNIIEHIGEGFPRIRVGVGLCPPGRDLAGFVLARMTADEQAQLKPVFADFQELLDAGFTKGWDFAANRFNKRTTAGEPPAK